MNLFLVQLFRQQIFIFPRRQFKLIETKKTNDIVDISNQSSKEGIRIVLELKKDADMMYFISCFVVISLFFIYALTASMTSPRLCVGRKIKVRGKVDVEEVKGGKKRLVISEIPYTMIGSGIGKFLNDVANLLNLFLVQLFRQQIFIFPRRQFKLKIHMMLNNLF